MKKILVCFVLFGLLISGCGKIDSSQAKAISNANNYSLSFDYDHDSKKIDLEETLVYKNKTSENLNELYFHLYPNSFDEGVLNKPVGVLNESKAYPNGKSYGNIKIGSVEVDGKVNEFEYFGEDSEFLKIVLPKTLEKNQKVTVNIDAVVTLPNVNHRFGYGNNTINIGNSYPIIAMYENGWVLDGYHSNGDPFYSDIANYNVSISALSSLKLATTGEIKNSKNDDLNTIYSIEAKGVRDFAFVLSEEFKVINEKVDDVLVNYYYFNDENYEKNLKTSVDSLKFFSEQFGEYPYKVLNVVQTNFVHGGMEYPNLVYISDDVKEIEDYTNVIIHEIAHQWWYGVIGNNEYDEAWLDEGLTEYSVMLFYEFHSNYNVNHLELIKASTNNYALFVELYTKVLGEVNTSMNRRLDEFETEPEYVYNVYVKGMLFFDNIRELIGDDNFFKGLKNYYANNAFTNVSSQDLLREFEKSSGRNLESVFNSWLEGKVSILRVE